jgi:uncharacterized SAM-binding protein YcdF (DUF218 family)
MSKIQPAPSDVIIVAGHKNLGYRQARINKAIKLYLAGAAKALLLCGGGFEAVEMAKTARQAGIPDTAMVLEQQSSTTLENALYSARIIDQRKWRSAIIVSDGYHLARLWLCFRQSALSDIQLVSTPFPSTLPAQCRWLLALLREGLALPYYWLQTLSL